MIDLLLVACTMMCIEYALDHRSPVASHLQFVRGTESDELEALRGYFQLYHEEKYKSSWNVQNLYGDGSNNTSDQVRSMGTRNDVYMVRSSRYFAIFLHLSLLQRTTPCQRCPL